MSAATTNLQFGKGVLIMDPDGEAIELFELQDATISIRDTTVEARGKGLFPLAVELAERSISITVKWLRVTAEGMEQLLGGTLTGTTTKTLALTSTSAPTTFKMTLKNPSDGSDLQAIFYKVRPKNFTLPLTLKQFSVPDVEFDVMVDETTGKVADFVMPQYVSLA